MRLELTEHDIRLLKFSGCILAVFLIIRFLLMPGLERFQENLVQRDMLDETISEMQASIDGIPLLEQGIERRRSRLEELSSVYYGCLENRQVDELLTGIALEHGLFPLSLSMEGAAVMIPEPYLHDAADGGEAVSDYMRIAAGSMMLRGEEAGILAFLDDLEDDYPAIRLCSLSVSDKMYFDQDWNMVGQSDISCRLEIYMCDPAVLEGGGEEGKRDGNQAECLRDGVTGGNRNVLYGITGKKGNGGKRIEDESENRRDSDREGICGRAADGRGAGVPEGAQG